MKKNVMLANILSCLAKEEEKGSKFGVFIAKGNRELNQKLREQRKAEVK